MDTPQQTPGLASEYGKLNSRIIESSDGFHHHEKTDEGLKTSFSRNGVKGSFEQGTTDEYDPNLTRNVISAMGPKTSPRMRQVMTSLIQHLHGFAREVNLTVPEWMAAVEVASCFPSLYIYSLLTKTRLDQ
jgi:Catechol dioxygenase N terminus